MDVIKDPGNEQSCRICRCSEGGQLLIFGVSGAERAIPDKIHECLPIKVSMKDGLPQTICGECFAKLDTFARFRDTSRHSESLFSGMCSSISTKSDSDNSKTSEKDKDLNDENKQKQLNAQLAEPHPEDYVLMKEETLNVDNTFKTSNVIADYLVEFNNNNSTKLITEPDMPDRDIVLAMRKRNQILPPMWDVFERVQSDQDRQVDNKGKSSKQTLRTALKGKFSVIHRRYIIAKGAFPCSLCGRCFRFNQGQSRDSTDHEDPLSECDADNSLALICNVCNKTFERNEHLARHMLTHSGARPFQCDLCNKVFTRKEHLVRHRALHLGESSEIIEEKPFVCDLCNVCYARREQMVKHKKVVHNIEDAEPEPKPYACAHCSKTFTRKEHLVRHKKIHLREIPLTVNTPSPQVVKQVSSDTVTLEISSTNAHSTQSVPMSTILEQGRYGEVSIERKPMRASAPTINITPDTPEQVPYYTPDELTEEQRAQLEGFLDSSIGVEPDMSYESERRHMEISYDDYAEEKESIGLEDLKKMPKCRICLRSFGKKNHLNRHLRRYHNLSKEQVNSGKYEMCENGEARGSGDGVAAGAAAGNESLDVETDDLIDEDGTPILKRPKCSFTCGVCRKTFTRKYHMYRHQKTQHGIQFPTRDQQKDEVKCPDCGLIFLTTDDLAAHECVDEPGEMEREPRRKIPSAASTFKCAICKGTFDSHEGFKDHDCKKLHKCTVCSQTFDKLRLLAKHMESVHGTATAPATPTPATPNTPVTLATPKLEPALV